jgi:hypothetical protein
MRESGEDSCEYWKNGGRKREDYRTVKTAKEIVAMMKVSELLIRSMYGGVEPCWVSEDSHFHCGGPILLNLYLPRLQLFLTHDMVSRLFL